ARVMRVLTANISLLFFFSSRRRHTRSKRDWSSDVCSSDLTLENPLTLVIAILTIYGILYAFIQFAIGYANQKESDKYWGRSSMRSEERRVGKECSNEWQKEIYKRKLKKNMNKVEKLRVRTW